MSHQHVDVSRIVDSAPLVGLPLRVVCLCFLIAIVDGLDLQAMAFVAPALVRDWHIAREQLGPALAASVAGMALGSVLIGMLSDRYGRKPALSLCMGLLCLGSLLCAQAASLGELFAYRFATGIGLGGAAPVAASLVAEWVAERWRGAAVTLVIVAVPLGGMAGAALARVLIALHGWRSVFLAGSVLPLACVVLALVFLPESPRFLATAGGHPARLAALLNRLTGSAQAAPQYPRRAEPALGHRDRILALLRAPHVRTTVLLWIAFAGNTLTLYGYVNWLPTVLSAGGASVSGALDGSLAFNGGGLIGASIGGLLIARYGSRLIGAGVAAIGVVASAVIGAAMGGRDGILLLTLVTVAGACINGLQAFLYAVGAHAYPTNLRSTGIGCASAVARIGGVLSSALASALFSLGLWRELFFDSLGAVLALTAVSFWVLPAHIPRKSAGR